MNCNTLRIATVIFAVGGLNACAAIQDSQVMKAEFWTLDNITGTSETVTENDQAELGLAALAKGNNVLALGYFGAALKSNPNDVHALYGLALLYQNTGQPVRAREYYEQILAIRPAPKEEILIWADRQTHPITDITQVNLQLLQSGSTAPLPGAIAPMQPGAQQAGVEQGTAQPQSQLYVAPIYKQGQSQAPAQPPVQPAATPMFKSADLNIVSRFKALRTLLGQGLITQEEFIQRRQANIGALLPLTSQPPATGLGRPVPQVDQVSGRLRAISRALEMRALSPAQHTAERSMILDALMPAQPKAVELPALMPKGLMEAADLVRRLEMLRESDIITSDEYLKERAAIERTMQPAAAKPPTAAAAPVAPQEMAKPKGMSGFQPAVHLASYRRKGAAERGWVALTKRFSQLSGLEPRIERVDLGSTKGVFYRLKAGPLPSNNAAKDICRKLKAKRQFCEPTTINFG